MELSGTERGRGGKTREPGWQFTLEQTQAHSTFIRIALHSANVISTSDLPGSVLVAKDPAIYPIPYVCVNGPLGLSSLAVSFPPNPKGERLAPFSGPKPWVKKRM